MAKILSLKDRFLSVLFWSVIAAAFIGPGTVTTAAKAGASFQLSLLWTLVFSTFATIVLQEAAARITIASGKSLGEIIALKYQGQKGYWIKRIIFVAVAFGCAAYQAGNMLGAVAGMNLFLSDLSKPILTISIGLIAGILLWLGHFKTIANLLGLVVAAMGIAFVTIAVQSDFALGTLVASAFIPSFPTNSELLIISLVGTTIVPYNLFLASGISQGQNIAEMRIGIGIAVLIGGIISMAILLVGTQLNETFSFAALAATMAEGFGTWATVLFGFGLFAAGMTSSITSPFAAAITAKSLFGKEEQADRWGVQSTRFRLVWGGILAIGLLFGLSGLQPVATIVFAQAINGVLLPVVAIFLFLIVNDQQLLREASTGKQYSNSFANNLLMLLIVGLSSFLGMINILKVLHPTASLSFMLGFAGGFTLVVSFYLAFRVFRKN